VPAADPGRWADAIGRLLTDGPRRDRLRAAGQRRAAEFTWTAAAERLVRACAYAAAKECELETMSAAGKRTT
jgi:glycosyltransferase involved in cell wall biosynthesis